MATELVCVASLVLLSYVVVVVVADQIGRSETLGPISLMLARGGAAKERALFWPSDAMIDIYVNVYGATTAHKNTHERNGHTNWTRGLESCQLARGMGGELATW